MRDAINPGAESVLQDGLSQDNPSPGETVRLGQAAMARARHAWEDWLLIAAALLVGQTEAMRAAHTNRPTGRRYEHGMGAWLSANGFKAIDKAARSRLLQCLEHRDEIERWRARLTEDERFRFNHPNTVWRRWQNSIIRPAPNLDEPQRLSPVGKLKESVAALEEDNHRMRREIERGGGDVWSREDTAPDIAAVMVTKLGPTKAERVGRELLKLAKAAKAAASGPAKPASQRVPVAP